MKPLCHQKRRVTNTGLGKRANPVHSRVFRRSVPARSPSVLPSHASRVYNLTKPPVPTRDHLSQRRVVVTGIGVVSPLGTNIDDVYARLLSGRGAIDEISDPELTKLKLRSSSVAQIGTKLSDADQALIPTHLDKLTSRHQRYAIVAAHKAMEQANIVGKPPVWAGTASTSACAAAASPTTERCGLCADEPSCAYQPDTSDRLGVCVGSSIGCVEEIGASHVRIEARGARAAGAYSLPRLLVNLAAGHIAQIHSARALVHSVSTACATGAHAIGDAYNFIRANKADMIIAGGTESGVSPLSMALFDSIRALSRSPSYANGAPFSTTRDGFVMGEGAAIMILESLESAQQRNANILCELIGYGISSDAYHVTQPHNLGRGAYMAMQNALQDAGVSMCHVDYINAHATSTPIGDRAEMHAIQALTHIHHQLAQSRAGTGVPSSSAASSSSSSSSSSSPIPCYSRPVVSSTKGHTGHLLGSSGSFEAAITAMSVATNSIPPTLLRAQATSLDAVTANITNAAESTTQPHVVDTSEGLAAVAQGQLAEIDPEMMINIAYMHSLSAPPESSQPSTPAEPSSESTKQESDDGEVTSTANHSNNQLLRTTTQYHWDSVQRRDHMEQGQPPLETASSHVTDVDIAMSNSFGFGGANASLIFAKFTQ